MNYSNKFTNLTYEELIHLLSALACYRDCVSLEEDDVIYNAQLEKDMHSEIHFQFNNFNGKVDT